MSKALAYAVTSKTSPMAPITISRREPRSNDVNIEILYCGVCHTDIHMAHSEWDGLIYPNGTIYPCVPGHEIVGRVTSVGPDANPDEMNAQAGKLDFILNTVALPHSLDTYLGLLGYGGTMALVGIPEKPHPSPSVASLMGLRRGLAGSLVGGIKET